MTDSGTLRQPSLQGFRTDLNPDEVLADEDMQPVLEGRQSPIRIRQVW